MARKKLTEETCIIKRKALAQKLTVFFLYNLLFFFSVGSIDFEFSYITPSSLISSFITFFSQKAAVEEQCGITQYSSAFTMCEVVITNII